MIIITIRIKRISKSLLIMLLFLSGSTIASILVNSGEIGKDSIIMLYLLAVLFTTVLTKSYIFGVISAFAGVMLFNFFFTEPRFSLIIHSSKDIFMLAFFFVTAIVAGSIMSRLQKQMDIAQNKELTANLLSEVSGGFLHVTGMNNIVMKGISYIREYSGFHAKVTLSDTSEHFEESDIDTADIGNAHRYPINGVSEVLGYYDIYNPKDQMFADHELLFKTVATQTGIALDREYIYNEREEIRIAMERERLRSTLLRAVAHDLRSPLTALSGASSVLSDRFEMLTVTEQKKLAKDISEEMIWLTNLVENILNMTRINESQLVLYKNFEVLDDVVGEALSHMQKLLADREFSVSLPNEVVAVPMDGKLIAQVIINLLDNAIRHTQSNAAISLSVTVDNDKAVFTVADTGEGIDTTVKDALFQGFVRSEKSLSDGKHGMGLGLTICRAVVEAHGGQIWINDNHPHGVNFCFSLPLEDSEVQNGKQT